MSERIEPGTLYIVATPIGNLEDISHRALRILSEVDLIAAEDTRTTRVLLDHFHIRKSMISYHNFNEQQRASQLLSKLRSGLSIALVSEAGTPGISDPAYRIVHESIQAGIHIVPIPGASAFLLALVASGLPMDRFVFEGFLPHKKGRKTRWSELAEEDRTIVLYESPHRLTKTLQEMLAFLGDREIAIARELTKKFEEIVRGKVSDLLRHFSTRTVRGEFVVIISGLRRERLRRERNPSS